MKRSLMVLHIFEECINAQMSVGKSREEAIEDILLDGWCFIYFMESRYPMFNRKEVMELYKEFCRIYGDLNGENKSPG